MSNSSAGNNHRKRMTGKERREQLLDIGRRLFAERGFEGTSIEEIAAQADVSKPVVYEHFGGKEGLYAVVVDREVERFLAMATSILGGANTREKFEAAAVALLRYIEDNSDGFRILVRDSPSPGSGTFGSLISDIDHSPPMSAGPSSETTTHTGNDLDTRRIVRSANRSGQNFCCEVRFGSNSQPMWA